MPSFQDSAIIFILALLLFGPKKLPVLARELGKWLAEFRRASNDFKTQMEEELRVAERDEKRKISDRASLDALDAAKAKAAAESAEASPSDLSAEPTPLLEDAVNDTGIIVNEETEVQTINPQPSPIAVSGDLTIMPPATGLPVAQTGAEADLTPLIESIPVVDTPHHESETAESAAHG